MIILFLKKNFKYNLLAIRSWVLEHSFNNTWGKLRITIKLQVLSYNLWNLKINNRVLELDDFTDNIVRKLIIYQVFNIWNNFINKSLLLLIASCFETGLHNTAALLILGDWEAVLDHCWVYWLFVGVWGHNFKASLNHVISVDVYREFVDAVFDCVWKD